MTTIGYELTVGSWSVNSADDPRTELLRLDTLLALNLPGGRCRVCLYAPPPQPGVPEQMAAGMATGASGLDVAGPAPAFTVQVRGEAIEPDDRMELTLTVGNRTAKVISADVQAIRSSLGELEIVGTTALQKLTVTRLNQVYENQTLQQIVRDLAGQAGVRAGDVAAGSSYPYLVVDDSRNVFDHLRRLALRDGCDVSVDTDNQMVVAASTGTEPDHTLLYGVDLLDIAFCAHGSGATHVQAYGESPASNRGLNTWHWLAKDLGPFRGDSGDGTRLVTVHDGAVRTRDMARAVAATKLGRLTEDGSVGRVKLLGRPDIRLGHAIELKRVPRPELNGVFRVTSVRHVFSKRHGLVSWVGFSGTGGAQAVEGLLGDVAGTLAGAVGT